MKCVDGTEGTHRVSGELEEGTALEVDQTPCDGERDLVPARSQGLKTILMGDDKTEYADHKVKSLPEAVRIILDSQGT